MEKSSEYFIFMGLKHSGKSSLARMASHEFGLESIDIDDRIAEIGRIKFPEVSEINDNASCVRALYHHAGKSGFQEIETQAASQIVENTDSVRFLALGGGTMENPEAMAILSNHGVILFLDVPSELLYKRIIRGGIPAFLDPQRPEEHFHEIYEKRRKLSLSYAQFPLDVGARTMDDVFISIKPIIKEFLHAR